MKRSRHFSARPDWIAGVALFLGLSTGNPPFFQTYSYVPPSQGKRSFESLAVNSAKIRILIVIQWISARN
uniref:Uncharacterized protein n=1 Tax=Myoviridae sp. ctxym25 TaxID=2825210 RepID=A0A8S5QH08_9CAUD|nr:MAG TPA: hypothetical protein [Myoviridae sp. ctxym25]